MAPLRWAAALLLMTAGQVASAHPPDRWKAYVDEASSRFDIPGDWIRRVMLAESGGRTFLAGRPITSPVGAMGLMQLMPGTWQDMHNALRLGSDPYDPRDNILAGAAYLRIMYDLFGYPGLFGAYNAGPGRFTNYLMGRARLPRETAAYVALVQGMAVGRTRPRAAAGGKRPGLFVLERRAPESRVPSRAFDRQLFSLRVTSEGGDSSVRPAGNALEPVPDLPLPCSRSEDAGAVTARCPLRDSTENGF